MNLKYSNKLKAIIISSLLPLTIINPVLAADSYNIYNHDQNSNFSVFIGSQSPDHSGSIQSYYLYWCANDTQLANGQTLKGGNWYMYSMLNVDDGGGSTVGRIYDYHLLGSGSMSEEEIKQAIDDSIHNVEGDMTVDGSQDITGDQNVDGEQTVNGGQTVSGSLLYFER